MYNVMQSVDTQDGSGSKTYDDGGCDTESQCYVCSFNAYPKATLRGLCENEVTDVFYTIMWDEEKNLPYYRYSGLFVYALKFN